MWYIYIYMGIYILILYIYIYSQVYVKNRILKIHLFRGTNRGGSAFALRRTLRPRTIPEIQALELFGQAR